MKRGSGISPVCESALEPRRSNGSRAGRHSATRPRLRIAEPAGFSARALERLREVADVELAECRRIELARIFAEVDAFWFRLGHRIDAAMLPARPRCRILATPVTGLDHIDLESCAARGMRVVSLKGEVDFLRNVRATAELTVGLALALMRRIPSAAADVLRGRWDRAAFRGSELHGRTAGIVGVGRLGSLVAESLRGFGMRVIGFDPRPDFPEHVARVDSLAALFAQSDLVSVHATYDATTDRLIDARALAHARPGAVLVNTARAGLVDEAALLAALESQRIAGAALDVISGEPDVGQDHPLIRYARSHENLLIVPHLGGNTFEAFEKTECFLAERVASLLRDLDGRRGS
jgi:D-3-phosphoglycerate dehydrogenase